MSGIFKLCCQLFGSCCCCGGKNSAGSKSRKMSVSSDVSEVNEPDRKKVIVDDLTPWASRPTDIGIHRSVVEKNYSKNQKSGQTWTSETKFVSIEASTNSRASSFPVSQVTTGENRAVLETKSGNSGNRSVTIDNEVLVDTSVQLQLVDGMSKIVSSTFKSFSRIVCLPWKARRKEKDSSGGGSGGLSGASDEGKLYLESALLERHLNETELQRLVTMPLGLDENEWIASHTISLFEHVNLIYGTISEFCTSTTCPDMTGPCTRTYLWFDEKGKKVKVAAPQYVDYVMTFIQKTINDESIFPTKSTNAFPSSFKPIVKKICRLMFHVIAHIYHCHFKEIVLLSLHAHLNCVFAHFTIFNEAFKLVEEKETEILQDLSLAMKLRSDLIADDPMSDSNKENISLSKSASGRLEGIYSSSSVVEGHETTSTSSHDGNPNTTTTSTSTLATLIPSLDSLLIKEPPALVINSELH